MLGLIIALAFAASPQKSQRVFSSLPASADHTTDSLSAPSLGKVGSTANAECSWAGVVGAGASIEVDRMPADSDTWTSVSSSSALIVAPAGSYQLSFTLASGFSYRVAYTHGSVSVGTLDCYVSGRP